VHNINWVGGEPTVHLHNIVEAIALVAKEGLGVLQLSDPELETVVSVKADPGFYELDKAHALYGDEFNVPMLWNSNFYMSMESMRILRTLIDVWLPDFKFGNNKCALRLSRTPWYFETVARNHKLVYEWGEDIVIRHLVMPNHVECCTKPVLRWIADNMPEVPVNIMDQYHPDNYCDPYSPKFKPEYAEIARRPTREELMETYRYAKDLGLNFEVISFEKKINKFHGIRSRQLTQ
jgi:putative pyruvate formate lyase activating enzyme